MLKVPLLSLFLLAAVMYASAQNLIPNPSFEDTAHCDGDVYSLIEMAPPWFDPTLSTPDIFDADTNRLCGYAMDPNDIVLVSELGYEAPSDGLRFAGIITWEFGTDVKEYISVPLTSALQPMHSYRLALKISLADQCAYALDRLGAWFTVNPPSYLYSHTISAIPQNGLTNDGNYLNNRNGWIELADTLLAVGGEDYMTIGSFQDSSQADVLTEPVGPCNKAYYFIDQVELVEVFLENINEHPFTAIWSDSGINGSWNGNGELHQIAIHDLLGKLLWEIRIAVPTGHVTLVVPAGLAPGLYLLRWESTIGNGGMKIIKPVGDP